MPARAPYAGAIDPAFVAVRFAIRRDGGRGGLPPLGVWHLAEVLGPPAEPQYHCLCGVERRTADVRAPEAVRPEAYTGLGAEERCIRCLQVLAMVRGWVPSEWKRRQARERRARGEDVNDSYDNWTYDPDGRRW